MNILKRLARIASNLIFYVLLAIIILLIVYVIVINVYKKQDRLGEIPINFYTILTTSMVPKIDAGDIIITYKNKDNIYKDKDVITFVSQANMTKGVTITHRIIKTEILNGNYYYYTKGDANNTADSTPVSSENVVGKVILKIPKAGYLQQFMVSKFGWLVVIVLPCMSIIIYDAIKIIKKMFKINKDKNLLSLENTKTHREILNKTIETENVSDDLQQKINNINDEIKIDKNNTENKIEKTVLGKEDDDIEIL